jgi:hypothetical protein
MEYSPGPCWPFAFANLGLTRNLDCEPLKSRETYSVFFMPVRLLALQDFLST